MGDLKDLTDATSPLMERFKDRAPGTYKHCAAVASLCETIGMELGLDIPHLKAAGLLHDIGKMFNAEYFTENQSGEKNPHDTSDPFLSYQVLTRHVSDSILFLIQYPEIPREVLEIISEHHGTTVLASIYAKVKNTSKKTMIEEDHYRYKSSKPRTTEAAVLMIVDAVEATARARHNSGNLSDNQDRRVLVETTITRLEDDEQLDELKLGTVRVIRRILSKELDTLYHQRTSNGYDEEKTEE